MSSVTTVTTVIFDMYNTLVQNHSDLWLNTFKQIVKEQDLGIDPNVLRKAWLAKGRQFRLSRTAVGAEFQSYFQSWRRSLTEAYRELSLVGDPIAAAEMAVLDHCKRPPFPETREALARIQRQFGTAVASNADDDFLKPNLELAGLEFEQVLSSEEARSYKPDPGLFREVMRRLEVQPGECLYVGDRQLEDVQGPRGVGMRAVWVNRGGEPLDPDLPAPDFQVANLLELLDLPELREFA